MLWHARDMVGIVVCKIHVPFKLDEKFERLVEVKDLTFCSFSFLLFPSQVGINFFYSKVTVKLRHSAHDFGQTNSMMSGLWHQGKDQSAYTWVGSTFQAHCVFSTSRMVSYFTSPAYPQIISP
jgi:hypothetical protein